MYINAVRSGERVSRFSKINKFPKTLSTNMTPERWIKIFVHLYCLLTGHLVKAVYWNWFLTNPHDIETDVVDTVRHDEPLPFSHSEDLLRRPRQHPKDTWTTVRPPKVRNAEEGIVNDYDQSVSCSLDRDCKLGTFCDQHYGICKTYKNEGQPCRSNGHCAVGLDCMFGRCLASAKPGHKGARCISDRDCLPSMCCARQHGERICKPKLKIGQNCFVPDGGLSYWLNEMCPCEETLICGYVTKLGQPGSSNSDWLNVWTDENRMRCIMP